MMLAVIGILTAMLIVACVGWRRCQNDASAAERRAEIAEAASDAIGDQLRLEREKLALANAAMTDAAAEIGAWRERWIKAVNNGLELAHLLQDEIKRNMKAKN